MGYEIRVEILYHSSSTDGWSDIRDEHKLALIEIDAHEDMILCGAYGKWYSFNEALRTLSIKYPGERFGAKVTGEDGAPSRVYACNGKVKEVFPTITWPEVLFI